MHGRVSFQDGDLEDTKEVSSDGGFEKRLSMVFGTNDAKAVAFSGDCLGETNGRYG